jgi:tetratricopeptide (TPR) repeat protein
VILTAMAYDAKDRYRDAGAFAADLTAVAEGRSPHARPPGLWRRARAWSHRRPLLAVALILGPPLVGAAVWAAAELREAARRSSRIELAQEVRRLSRDVFRVPALQEAGVEDTAALLERVRALLERDPAHVQLLFLQTWLEAKSGRPDDALAAFERHPSFRDSVEGRTLCAFLRRTTEAADADLAEIVGAGPIPAESRYLVAVILLEWDPLAARARIDIGLQDRDLDPFVRCTFLLFRGLVRTRLGDLEGAEEDFAAGSSLDPEDASALAGRWSLARRLRGAEAAAPLRERLHAWIRGDPFRAPDAAMVVVSLEDPDAGREFLGTRPPENPKLGLRWDLARIRCAARPVPTDDDVAAADEARRRHPGTAVIHHEAGHLYGAARDSDRVCEAFDRAAALDPGNPSPWICRASELLRCAGSEAALTALEEARRRGGSERLIATYEVFIHSHSNDPAAALPRIDALLAQGIDTGMIRLNQGVALVRLGRAPEAVDAFERARARLPGDAAVVAGLAIALCSAGEPTKAVEVCDAALTRGIAGAKVPEAKAQALLQLGRPAEALIAAEDAIRREPRSAGAHYFRSGLLRELGRRDEAIDTYVRSFALPVTDMTSALVAARSFHALDPERAGPVLRDTFLPLARRSRLPPSDRRPLALFLDRVLGEEEAAAALDPGAVGR